MKQVVETKNSRGPRWLLRKHPMMVSRSEAAALLLGRGQCGAHPLFLGWRQHRLGNMLLQGATNSSRKPCLAYGCACPSLCTRDFPTKQAALRDEWDLQENQGSPSCLAFRSLKEDKQHWILATLPQMHSNISGQWVKKL